MKLPRRIFLHLAADRRTLTVREVGLNKSTALAPQDGGHLHVAPIPPRAVGMPRAVTARAMPRMLLTPLAETPR